MILHTNDVHVGFEDNIGYDGLALYKNELEELYDHVLLVDASDAIQGAPIGAVSKGAELIKMMNRLGYDLAVPGNHEFDFGFTVLDDRSEELKCGYTCANFCVTDGERRVTDVKIGDEPLDLEKEYTLTSTNFVLTGGDGYSMFKDATILTMLPDNEVFMKYLKENLNGVIPDTYQQASGRLIWD